jgi:acyl carrier protein
MKLVLFLEERYGVTLEAHEVDPEHLDTVTAIVALVRLKQPAVFR